MNESMLNRCKLFIINRDIIKSNFVWENSYIHPLCASIFISRGLEVNAEKLKECMNLIKQKTGFFSNFRGVSKLVTATFLALDENPNTKIDKVLQVYDLLKQEFFANNYLPITAMVIADLVNPDQFKEIVQRTKRIYDLMKNEHPFLTCGEDSTYAALLALSKMDDSRVVEEMERCYENLKPHFISRNPVQSLSHALTLGEGDIDFKCSRTLELFNYLKVRGYKYGTGYELSTLGVLALVDINIDILVQDMISVDEYLRGQKGFGPLGIGTKQRLMYAGMLTMCELVDETVKHTMKTSAINGVISIILAQQAAIFASMAAASATAASSTTF